MKDSSCIRKNFLIVCGGVSVEHDVSLTSAQYVLSLVDTSVYQPLQVVIGQDGRWRFHHTTLPLPGIPDGCLVWMQNINGQSHLIFDAPCVTGDVLAWNSLPIDVVFPLVHGTGGEDGTLQGFFETLGVPYVGCDVLSSALGMDKVASKRIWQAEGLPTAPFLVAYPQDDVPSYAEVFEILGESALFIKPANTGSSVGVSRVTDAATYQEAIREALRYDHKLIIEKEIAGQEIECAILGHGADIATSGVGEILVLDGPFYTYDVKYLEPEKARILVQARLTADQVQRVQTLALAAFRTLGCSGMARVDFFLTPDDELYLNEINTIPGFTPHSLYPKLFEQVGVHPKQLLERLITSALDKAQDKARLLRTRPCPLTLVPGGPVPEIPETEKCPRWAQAASS